MRLHNVSLHGHMEHITNKWLIISINLLVCHDNLYQ